MPAFRFFKTLTGLHKGSFSITVLSLPAVVTLPSDLDVTPEGRVGREIGPGQVVLMWWHFSFFL